MAALHAPPRVEPQPDQHVAAERFDQTEAFARFPVALDGNGDRAIGQACENLFDQRQALFDLADADPHPRVDIAGVQHRYFECEIVIGRVAGGASRIEAAARRASDISTGAEPAREGRLHDAGRNGAVLQRSGVVVQLDKPRKHFAEFDEQHAQLRGTVGRHIARDAARHDDVHHQPVAEADLGCAQAALAQNAGLRMHQRESGVVADSADVAEMVRQALELGHQRAQVERARWRRYVQRGFGGLRKGVSISDGAVAGSARGQLRGGVKRGAVHQ